MFRLVFWDFIGKVFNQVIGFGVSIILARLLQPWEFGIIGIALALVSFSSIFYDFGLKTAIIQAEQVNQRQLSTIFFLNLIAGSILFGICAACSSLVEAFYAIPGLSKVVIAVASLFLINSVASLPIALLSRKLQFKKIAMINLIASLIAGATAVTMAFTGWGVWSLIANTLISAFIVLVGVFYAARWKPGKCFDLSSIKPLWKFGGTVFGIEVLESIFSRIDVFLIGKVFSASTLGFYTRAQSLDSMVKQFSSNSLVAVVLPYFSKIRGDLQALKELYLQSLHIIAMAALGVTGLLYVTSVDLFLFLFTSKWSFAGELFRIIAISGFAYPVSALMVNVILSLGRTREIVRLEVVKKLILLPVFIFGFYGGIKVFLMAMVGAYWVIVLLNAYAIRSVTGIRLLPQLWAIGQYIIVALSSVALTVLITREVDLHSSLNLIVKGGAFALLYVLINYFTRTPGSRDVSERITGLLRNRGLIKMA